MKLCLIGRILSIIAAASIYQSVHWFVYCCKNAYISPKKQLPGLHDSPNLAVCSRDNELFFWRGGGRKSSGYVGLELRQEMQSYGSH